MKHSAFSSKWGPSRLLSLVLQALRLLYSDSTQLCGVEHGVHTRPVKFSHFQNRPVTRNEPGPKQVNEAFPRSLWYGLKVIFKKWPLSLTCRLRTRVRWESGKHRLSACYLKVKRPAAGLLDFSPVSSEWLQHFFIPRRKSISFDENKISKQRRPSSIINVYRAHNRSMNAPRISIRHLET